MTHDLDDLIRQSLHRNAEAAPASVDLDGVRHRARAIGRRRTLETGGAVAATLAVVAAAGIGVSTLRAADPVAPPATSTTPSSLPTGAASTPATPPPASKVSTPSGTPAPAELPWAATVVVGSGGTEVWLQVDGVDTRVEDAGNASASVLGWYGADRRTLVYQVGEDLQTLRMVEVGADGTTIGAARDLVLTGETGAIPGHAFGLGPDGFAVVRYVRSSTRQEVVYVDAGFTMTSHHDLPAGVPVLATKDVVGIIDTAPTLTLVSATGTSTRTLPESCPSETYAAGIGVIEVSPDGARAAVPCDRGRVALVSLALDATTGSVVATDAVPGGGGVIAAWFDSGGQLFASSQDSPRTTTSSSVRTSWWDGEGWNAADTQNVVLTDYSRRQAVLADPGGHYTVSLYAEPPGSAADANANAWFTDTDTALQIGPGTGRVGLGSGGPTLALR